jgi:hypothetical protein
MDEKQPVDMTRHQRPYTRGPQARKNIEDDFAREFPGETVAAAGEARYEEMEARLRLRAVERQAARIRAERGRDAPAGPTPEGGD